MGDRRSLVADDGVTIFLTTQYLEEADQLADRVAVLALLAVALTWLAAAIGPATAGSSRSPGASG
ncbi:hypothetical protein NRF20_05450 [Streptomyces sp. R-74717]